MNGSALVYIRDVVRDFDGVLYFRTDKEEEEGNDVLRSIVDSSFRVDRDYRTATAANGQTEEVDLVRSCILDVRIALDSETVRELLGADNRADWNYMVVALEKKLPYNTIPINSRHDHPYLGGSHGLHAVPEN